MPTVTTRDGIKLHVKDVGRGAPVVLIHGWPLNADMWEYQIVRLVEAGYRVIAYDRRGFGRSDQPDSGYDYDTLADDLASILEQADARGAALVGFSMGGGEVARFLGKHGPRGFSSAVLIGSVTPGIAKSDSNPAGLASDKLDEMIAGLKKDRPHFLATFGKTFWGAGLLSSPASTEWMDWSQAMALQASPIATMASARAFGTTDFTADMRRFTLPTLVIHGTDDKTVPIDATARRIPALVSSAKMVEVAGAPHALFATHADEVNDALIAFLRH